MGIVLNTYIYIVLIINIIMQTKETKITEESNQSRTTIPKQFVDEFDVKKKKDKMVWTNKGGKLKAELKKGEKK